jgi:hypothetical protein
MPMFSFQKMWQKWNRFYFFSGSSRNTSASWILRTGWVHNRKIRCTEGAIAHFSKYDCVYIPNLILPRIFPVIPALWLSLKINESRIFLNSLLWRFHSD